MPMYNLRSTILQLGALCGGAAKYAMAIVETPGVITTRHRTTRGYTRMYTHKHTHTDRHEMLLAFVL